MRVAMHSRYSARYILHTSALLHAGAAIIALLSATSAAATTYDARSLDGLMTPSAINANGWVTGTYPTRYVYNAILYAGRSRALTPGTAYGINDEGTVVGASTQSGLQRAFRANPTVDDKIVDLGVLNGGTTSIAYAVNRFGVAVGSATVGAVDHAVVFEADKPKDLGYFAESGGVSARANGINDSGVIVGTYMRANGTYRPFQIIDGSADLLTGLNLEDLDSAQAISINNTGRILGNVWLSGGGTRAFFYENGKRTDIVPDGGGSTWASGQNNLGQIVGNYTVTGAEGTTENRTFVFDNGKFIDLQTLLGQDTMLAIGPVYAINDHGVIVVSANYSLSLLTPRVVPPVIQRPALPLPRIPAATDQFAASIAVAGDVAVVGAPGENNNRGAAYVYRFDGVLWREEARLVASDGAESRQLGLGVAIDGNTIVVTQPSAAYVFQRIASEWTQTAKLIPEYSTYTGFGTAVSVSGKRIAVGSPDDPVTTDTSTSNSAGAVYVYDWDDTQWNRTRLTASEPSNYGYFGYAVALQGNVVVVGDPAPCSDSYCNYTPRGLSYVFTFEGGVWKEQLLVPSYPTRGDGFGLSIKISGDRLVVTGYAAAGIFKRTETPAGTEWLEQDRIALAYDGWFGARASIDGDEIAIGFAGSDGATYARTYRSIGRVWFDTQRVDLPEKVSVNALAYQGKTLFFASATGNTVVPISICPGLPCDNTVVADLSVTVDAAASALIAENLTHTITVTNHHPANTAFYVSISSQFTTSSGAVLNWLDAPAGCVASLTVGHVACELRDLAPGEQRRLDFKFAAPSLSGTLTHAVSVRHVGPDPDPANNSATAQTAIVSTAQARIEIYSPRTGATIKRAPLSEVELVYEILGFNVGLNGNYFTVSVDGGTATRYDAMRKLSLGLLLHESHSVTVELRNTAEATPRVSKTVEFSVQVETPEVVIVFPNTRTPVFCRSNEPQRPKVVSYHWDLGTGGRHLSMLLNGQAYGGTISAMSAVETLDLCTLEAGRMHTIEVSMRNSDGTQVESPAQVTFEVRKATPNLHILEPVEGNTGYARSGFAMIYEFERGYDAAQVSATLNGTPLAGLFEMSKTNSFPLPQDLLRDGSNELVVTVTADGKQTQVSTVRFYTQAESPDAATSKGGAIDLFALALLSLLGVIRAHHSPGSRITPMRVALSRPRSK